jgi:hypothetical protein
MEHCVKAHNGAQQGAVAVAMLGTAWRRSIPGTVAVEMLHGRLAVEHDWVHYCGDAGCVAGSMTRHTAVAILGA